MRAPFGLGIAVWANSDAPVELDKARVNPCLFTVLDRSPTRDPFATISWITVLEFMH